MREKRSNSFNLGNGNGFSVKKILDVVENISGKKLNIKYGSRRDGDPSVLVGSSKKAQDLLGWKQFYDRIDLIVETAYNWHKKQLEEKNIK
jgi:UDP-glucose 4-epimerase